MKRSFLGLAAAALALALVAHVSHADDEAVPTARPERVSLVVAGEARAPADFVRVEVVVLASSQEPEEAELQHRVKLRGVLDALEELRTTLEEEARGAPPVDGTEPPSFSVALHEGGSMFNIWGWYPTPNRSRPLTTTTIATLVTVEMKGAAAASRVKLRKRLARILDTALEAGCEMGAGDDRLRPAVRFQAKDMEVLREAAYKDALDKGRERAARLARIGGRELGPLAGVTEAAWSLKASRSDLRGRQPQQQQALQGRWVDAVHRDRRGDYQGTGALLSTGDELATSLSEVEIEVSLAIDYELGKVVGR